MGYKTQVAPSGGDCGKDIIASPDGFGFENLCIVVEVKHIREQMSSQQIRSLLVAATRMSVDGMSAPAGSAKVRAVKLIVQRFR